MRILQLLFLALLFTVAAAALAGPEFDRARRNTAIARAALDAAETRLADARAEEDRIRIEMDRIRDKQRDVDRKTARLTDLKSDLPGQVRDEEAKLTKLNDEVAAAQKETARLQGPLREAIDRAKETLAKVKEIRAKYVKQFEISEPYQHAVIRAELAAKFQSATHRGVLDRTRASAVYKSAQEANRVARGKQSALKLDPDAETADRVAAANLVIQTESAVIKIENDALAADDSLNTAKSDAKKSTLVLTSLIEQFEKDLPRQPDMSEALTKHDTAQRAAELADAALVRAETRMSFANAALAAAKTAIGKMNEDQLKVVADLAAAVREADALSRDLDALSRRLADVAAVVNRAQRDVDAADRRYRDARAYEIVAARIDAQNEKGK